MIPVKVTQADRDAAADMLGDPLIRAGQYDDDVWVQAFARHRIATLEEAATTAHRALVKLDEPTQALIVSDALHAMKGQSNDQG